MIWTCYQCYTYMYIYNNIYIYIYITYVYIYIYTFHCCDVGFRSKPIGETVGWSYIWAPESKASIKCLIHRSQHMLLKHVEGKSCAGFPL